MNIKVIALTISAFCVGLIELIIGGILPQIADDFQVSISQAGMLITVFSICFAISGPILLTLTSKIERKKLLLISLFIFFCGTLLSAWAPSYEWLMFARMINAASGSLIIVLAITLSIKVVNKQFQARAIGFVSMGISSSIVIGIPIGVLISDWWNWRAVFMVISLLTIFSLIITIFLIDRLQPTKVITIKDQLRAVKRIKVWSAHTMMIFAMGGHYVLYAYLTPYMEQYYGLNANAISVIYFIFGFAAIAGGYLGGLLADKINPRRAVLTVLSIFFITLILLSVTRDLFYVFVLLLLVWGVMSWAISPPQQAYLIEIDPKTSDIQQSLHNSALQIGIALGSGLGGFIINLTNDVSANSWTAAVMMLLAIAICAFSISRPAVQKAT